jgi:hypothetical protein
VRGWWLICSFALGCSAGVGGSDSDANLGGGGSTGTSSGPGTSGTSAGTGGSSPSGTSVASTEPSGPGPTGDESASSEATTDPDATGEPSCDLNWRVEPVVFSLSDIAYDAPSDTVYAIGNDDGNPWVASLDACNGETISLGGLAQPSATSTSVRRLLASTQGLYVAGSVVTKEDPGNGLYARLDPDTLAPIWSQPLVGGGGFIDEVLQLTLSNAGAVWMAGTARVNEMPLPWTINGTTEGSACGFSAGAPSGSARAIAADGDSVVVAMRLDTGGLVLLGYDQTCTCMCQPQWTSPTIEIGTGDTSVGDMVAIDGQYYVAGWAHNGVSLDLFGYVAWLDGTGNLLGTYTDDVTPNGEGFLTMTAVGGTLYVGGGQAWDGQPGFNNANARLQALPIPFDGGAPAADWTALPQGLDIIEGVEASADYVYVGGNADGVATVLRCDTAGNCE